jgi:hypothetical protein
MSSTYASHVGNQQQAATSHAGGMSLVNDSHFGQMSPRSASHVGDMSTTSASHVEDNPPATASHAGGIDIVEKPRCIGCQPEFHCKICKRDHLTHLCLVIVPSSLVSYSVSQQYNQSLVDEVIIPIPYLADTSLVLGADAYLDHVVSHPIQLMVEEVVMLIQSSTNTTLLLESDKSKEVISLMQYSTDPTLILGSDAYFDHVLSISSSIPSEQGGISLFRSTLPPSPGIVSFDWNDLVEPRLPSSKPFQITILVESMLKGVHRCIVDEISSTSILSSSSWKYLGSPKLVLSTSELLAFGRRPSECLWILPQFPITLVGKNVPIDLLVVPGPLDFNMFLGHDYVYAMKAVVSTLFHVMHFSHNESIVTIDQLSYDNHDPSSTLAQISPLYVPSVRVDSSMPQVIYVVSYPWCSIAFEKESLQSCFASRERSQQLIMCCIQWGHVILHFSLLL